MGRKYMSGGALTAPIPPALVTVGDMDKSNVLTVAWTGILATKPPRTYVSVRPSRYSYSILKEKGEFVINLPTVSMVREVDYVGIYTGKKVDKFKKCAFTKVPSDKVSAPTIEECPVALECKVAEILPMGTHDVFVADIVGVSCDERLIDVEGKIHFERAELLAYAHGEYYALGELLGRFGFSTDKAPTQSKVSAAKSNRERAPRGSKKNLVEENLHPTNKFYDGRILGGNAERCDHLEEKRGGNKGAFYESAPTKRTKRVYKDKDKGKPHGRRIKEKQK